MNTTRFPKVCSVALLAVSWLAPLRAATTQPRYYAHEAVHDAHGVIAPWYRGLNGPCDYRVRIAAETLKRYPWTATSHAVAAYPHYVFSGAWQIASNGVITPKDPGDWMNGDLGQRATSVLNGFVDYYRYTGDPAAIAHLTYMADFLIEHGVTPPDHPWPGLFISVPVKGKAYGRCDPAGMIQLDLVASTGQGLLRTYQLTGNPRWLQAAKHWGDLLAERCRLEPGADPWPRYANPEAAPWKDNKQTGGVTMILAFLDDLIRMGHTGTGQRLVAARDAGRRYLRDQLLPAWAANDTWGRYFWDWANPVQNCLTTPDAARYLLEHPAQFPQWRTDARNVLTLFLHRSSVAPESGGDVFSGAWAYPEACQCCGRSLWYAPLCVAPAIAQLGVQAQSPWARELAYRQMVLATYDAHDTGVTEDNIDGGIIVNGDWFNIAQGLPLRWVLAAMAWLPEELGASRENHLLRSSAMVTSVIYGQGHVEYATFDAPAETVEVLRLAFVPKEVVAHAIPLAPSLSPTGGEDARRAGEEVRLKRRRDLAANGYMVKRLPNGDAIVTVRHDGARRIVITGNDPQEVLDDAAKTAGPWRDPAQDSRAGMQATDGWEEPQGFTPLTPALSPLRGEGVAMSALVDGTRRAAVVSPASYRRTPPNAAPEETVEEALVRAPSPLNGERAGVRGEKDPDPRQRATALTFQGRWTTEQHPQAWAGTLHSTAEAGATASARFQGNQVRLIGRADPHGGLADVYLDGEKQLVPVDCWNPAPRSQQVLYYRNGLTNAWHTLKLVARGARNPHAGGSKVFVDALQFSAEDRPHGYPPGTGPRETQRMIFGYTGREDYRDSRGDPWRPATEFITRIGAGKDSVAECWWTNAVTDTISGTRDPELYRYGVHAQDFWANLTVGPGRYHVRLKFAATRGLDTRRHCFDIRLNGTRVVERLEVAATAGGPNRAVDLVFNDVAPRHGIIEIRFTAARTMQGDQVVRGEAFVQALEIGPGRGGSGAKPVSAPAPRLTGNLLLNPGFEETHNGVVGSPGVSSALAGWRCDFTGPSQSYVWQESDYSRHPDWGLPEIRTGRGALRTHTDGQGRTRIHQEVEVLPGARYTASVWVRAADLRGKGFGQHTNDSAGLSLAELNSRGQVLRHHPKVELKTAGPYTRLSATVTPGKATAAVRFILEGILHCRYEEGHITFDDCALSQDRR